MCDVFHKLKWVVSSALYVFIGETKHTFHGGHGDHLYFILTTMDGCKDPVSGLDKTSRPTKICSNGLVVTE